MLPRIQQMHNLEQLADPQLFHTDSLPGVQATTPDSEVPINSVSFKNNKLYRHNILCVNYTTYDVWRCQDVINPRTSHCDILVLANRKKMSLDHHYRYGRVIGIFHTNVSYTGIGAIDHKARHIDFLWVCWFHTLAPPKAWKTCELDCLAFVPLSCDGAFGFVDPAHVLHTCHIVFLCGALHSDSIGISRLAKDSQDYCKYYANRYEL